MTDRPTGLPPVGIASKEKSGGVLEDSRLCKACKVKGRVISNSLGLSVSCPSCKDSWPISSAPLNPNVPAMGPRPLTKETHVEPDWEKAFED